MRLILSYYVICYNCSLGGFVAMMGHKEKIKSPDDFDNILCKRWYYCDRGRRHGSKKRQSRYVRRKTKYELKISVWNDLN